MREPDVVGHDLAQHMHEQEESERRMAAHKKLIESWCGRFQDSPDGVMDMLASLGSEGLTEWADKIGASLFSLLKSGKYGPPAGEQFIRELSGDLRDAAEALAIKMAADQARQYTLPLDVRRDFEAEFDIGGSHD